ncbi:MAG: glycogen/starch synthase, partial [Candidatus Nanohaloarchaea archaeon]
MSSDNFIEVSYEAAHKVGGIYQVLKSKAGRMKDFYGDDYYTIGFYDPDSAADEFAPRECPPELEQLKKAENGIEIHCGVWRVEGQPKCILVDASEMEKSADEIKEELYEEHGIDSINAGQDFNEPVRWSYAAGKVVSALEQGVEGDTVVQLHEWLSGPAMMNYDAPTVFTTHATVLGRTLSNADYDLDRLIEEDAVEDSMAEEHGVKAKHQTEKMAAGESDVFTTVSKVTGREAEAVLGVEPDMILPNGFNVREFPSLEELSYQHKKKKQEMKEFLRAYFEPYYDVDLEDDPRILFISGRYEFHNKGIDTFIDALAELNEQDGDDFFVFFFVPTDVNQVKPEVLENMSLYQELEDYVDSVTPRMRSSLIDALTSGSDPGESVKEVVEKSSGNWESLQQN